MVEMGSVIDFDVPLDYVEFQLFLSRDRYEACACSGDMVETVASGILAQLVRHIPRLKDLFSRGSKASFQIQCPKDPNSSNWFTKATVIRFLHIVGSVNILNTTKAIQDEITQLEESRKFHLSLYIKDERDTAPSDASKNELLRAINLRLTALKIELSTAINCAAGSICFPADIFNMEKLAQHLGDITLRNTLQKFLKLGASDQKVDIPVNSNNDTVNKSDEENQPKKPLKYRVCPGKKAAQIERQNSTEREYSSQSSEDVQPSVVKSRSLARLASPRRSSSPMRRVQIGKSGSRKAPALTIKSLNYIPGRDKTQTYRGADSCSSEEEGSKKPRKGSDSNAIRISVKDAISLFENKKKDHTSEAQKKRPTLDTETGANKSVLRRWSSGVGHPENVSESDSQLNSENWEAETLQKRMEAKTEFDIIDGHKKPVEDAKVDGILDNNEGTMSKPIENEPDILVIQYEEDDEKLTDSSELNRQKEAELNEMLTKMMQTKPRKSRHVILNKNGSYDGLCGKRGGVYDQYKGKRYEKLRGNFEKRAENDAQFRATRQVLEQRKAAMASVDITQSRSSLSKPEKVRKNLTQSVILKKESPKSGLTKKASSKISPSSVRKSWSSTPSPRSIMGVSPTKTPCGTSSSSTTPTRKKPNPGPIGPQPSPKVDRILQRSKPRSVKATQTDYKKSTKISVQKQPPISNTKISKPKSRTFCDKESSKDVAKPSFYTKVTKKSSVVPLESKPSVLHNGSGVNTSSDPVVRMKSSSPLKKPVKNLENPILVEENGVANTFGLVSQQNPDENIDLVSQQILDENLESDNSPGSLQPGVQLTTQQIIGDIASCEQVISNSDDFSLRRMSQPALGIVAEEDLTISPTAWVDNDEYRDSYIPPDDIASIGSSVVNVEPVETATPRVRHPLSQMLLQESELDMAEWGKSVIASSLAYQNDAPKGFKRLLKFPRKIKGGQNLTGWSSTSVFSEGEDNSEESKSVGKRTADTSLMKPALHAGDYGHQKSFLGEGHGRDFAGPQRLYDQLKLENFGVQSSSKRLQNHISSVATTTKATRSFFSLSAFRGNKPNETKIR